MTHKKTEEYTFKQYVELLKKDKSIVASPAERMLKAIGQPEIVDTAKDPRLSRIFGNRVIKRYAAFEEFYGMEDVIERIVAYFTHSSQGLEERKQILYLLGPVGSAKSSLAERLKDLMEQEPIYIIKGSPINESPLALLTKEERLSLGLPKSAFVNRILSPWAVKRLDEANGDTSKFKVIKTYPNQLRQLAISKTEPGDDNNQDISALVGKINIRRLDEYDQNDPDAYNYSGGLGLSNQGILEFVEMFKAPIKVLHPLLTATQEGNYKGTEQLGAIPFEGIVIAHSNASEWDQFKNNKNNEAFLDRVYIVKVPYCLRVDEEVKIYKKLISNSNLSDKVVAPYTLEALAQFIILSRLEDVDNSTKKSKMQVYNGENLKDKDPKAKTITEYKDAATKFEGFYGLSTRLAYKILAQVFNFDPQEIAANPVHLFYVLDKTIQAENLPAEVETRYLADLDKIIISKYAYEVGKDIKSACLDSCNDYGQALFDRYLLYADCWIEDNDYRDPDTGALYDRASLDTALSKIEKPAGISNPKDFRHEVVTFALRHRAKNGNNNPRWSSYEKLREVIEANVFEKIEELLPLISFNGHASEENQKKHTAFVENMMSRGYTERQVQLVYEWYTRYTKEQ